MTQEQAEKLGRVWEKNGMRRIYFNTDIIMDALNFKVDYYKTGNICSASYDGEGISNTQARKLMGRIREAKIWFDLADSKVHLKGDLNISEIASKLCSLSDNITA